MNAIKQLIEKSRKTPALAPGYALEVDRLLRGMGQAMLTFSANGVAGANASKATALGLSQLFEAQSGTPTLTGGNIHQAEMLVKQGKRSEALAHAFANAQGPEVNALNLFYANHATSNSKLRLHFLNKYLAAFGLAIELKEGAEKDFFHQIKSAQTPAKVDGPLVTVIMPAHNAERTIELAVCSLLMQTWHNLQIIVVDDASTDGTLQKAKDLAKRDPRVEVLSSPVNVGPYVCRNLGVLHTRGQWLTVHDADDWAFPDRIEHQVQSLTDANALECTGSMLRMNEQGQITRPIAGASTSEDCYLRLCYVSLMVQTAYFRKELGAWDSVRVGGDAELIERLKVLGTRTKHLRQPLMLCLDHEAGLTNHEAFGLSDENGQTQPLRADYKHAYKAWHKAVGSKKMPAYGKARPFEAQKANLVDPKVIKKVFATWAKNLELIKASVLFHAAWYKSQYPEIEQTGLDAEEHYLVHGATGATDPNPAFSSRFYLESRSLKTNPLVHYLRGKDAGPNPARVLLAAAEVAKTEAHERGIALAEAHLPHELAYTAHILKANAALARGNEAGWQEHLNAYLSHFNVAPICLDAGEGTFFDRLNTASLPPVIDGPLVTVIMPAWNAEKTVRKAVQSILNQTWRNLELLIVDDASTDATWSVLQEIAAFDYRVKIFRNKLNVGPYVSKNIALTQSKGEWITGHDADDWAHPERLFGQVNFCIENSLIACVSGMIRVTSAGNFVKLNTIKGLVYDGVCRSGLISLIVKTQFFHDLLGCWDAVRAGGDSELLRRLEKIQNRQIDEYKSFTMLCLDNPNGLTNAGTFMNTIDGRTSVHRINYRDSYIKWHRTAGRNNLRLDRFSQKRVFFAPREIEIESSIIKLIYESYRADGFQFGKRISSDVVIVTNTRFPGGNASSTLDELRFFRDNFIKFSLIHTPHDGNLGRDISDRFAEYMDVWHNWSEIEEISCKVLICRAPMVLVGQAFKRLTPKITTSYAFIVKNNSSKRPNGDDVYVIKDMVLNSKKLMADHLTFCPISPVMRDELLGYRYSSSDNISLSVADWAPTFDLTLYAQEPKPKMQTPFRIGRHGRDGVEKWLEDCSLLEKVYPSCKDFEIFILGGAKKAIEIMGCRPENWLIHEFGSIQPYKYLSMLDVFIYFPNSLLVEAFGRTVVEAMIAGIPVILPASFQKTFGDLPLYCEPNQVSDLVRKLATDDLKRVAYLTEIQQIATERYSSAVIARRLMGTGLPSNVVTTDNVDNGFQLSVKSKYYRARLLEFALETALDNKSC